MVGNSAELEIIDLFLKDLTLSFSINQIASKLKKAYPFIYNKTSELIKEGVITKKRVGRSDLCRLNLSSEQTIALVILLNQKKKKNVMQKISAKQKEKIEENLKSSDTDFIIYSNNKVFIAQNKLKLSEKELENEVQNINYDLFEQLVLSQKDFLENTTIIHSYEKYFAYLSRIEDKILLKYSPLMVQNEK